MLWILLRSEPMSGRGTHERNGKCSTPSSRSSAGNSNGLLTFHLQEKEGKEKKETLLTIQRQNNSKVPTDSLPK